jgi:hypothetical protein
MGIASAPQWPRETLWRQGAFLRKEDATRLRLVHGQSPKETRVVVVSHDCDVANDNLAVEPDVEVIVGRVVSTANGSYTHAKAPRTLHWEISSNAFVATIEMVATAKRCIQKIELANCTPDSAIVINPSQLHTLRYWLGIRYARAAFADTFERRMKDTKLAQKVARLMDRAGHGLSGIYFNVDDGEVMDRPDGEPYELGIVLTYPAGKEPEIAMDAAEATAEEIDRLITTTCFNEANETWSHIRLQACIAIAEDEITVAKAKQMTLWRLAACRV